MLHTSINGHSHLTISFYNMCMYTSMFNTLFYILKCFMPYDFLPFFLHFSLLDTTKTHKLNMLHLNLRFTGQLHQYIHTYKYIHSHIKYIVLKIYTQINTQTYIRLISKEYLSSSGIYKLIKVFLNISPQHRLYS